MFQNHNASQSEPAGVPPARQVGESYHSIPLRSIGYRRGAVTTLSYRHQRHFSAG